tara:strand:- start:670 stop:1302 length:633 start_codon:yes stop_codon:yes gene_type:complete
MYSYSNPKNNTLLFQYIIVVILIIISAFIYYAFSAYNINNKVIDNDLKNIDNDIKKIHDDTYYKFLDPQYLEDSHNISRIKNKIDNVPTVDDIVSAIFPGRNTLLVSGGNVQNINRSNDINTYSSDYAVYQPIKAFPVEPDDPLSIPMPLSSNNPLSRINNTYNNNNMDTQTKNNSLTRMHEGIMSSQNSSTGANNNDPLSAVKSKDPNV